MPRLLLSRWGLFDAYLDTNTGILQVTGTITVNYLFNGGQWEMVSCKRNDDFEVTWDLVGLWEGKDLDWNFYFLT